MLSLFIDESTLLYSYADGRSDLTFLLTNDMRLNFRDCDAKVIRLTYRIYDEFGSELPLLFALRIYLAASLLLLLR